MCSSALAATISKGDGLYYWIIKGFAPLAYPLPSLRCALVIDHLYFHNFQNFNWLALDLVRSRPGRTEKSSPVNRKRELPNVIHFIRNVWLL